MASSITACFRIPVAQGPWAVRAGGFLLKATGIAYAVVTLVWFSLVVAKVPLPGHPTLLAIVLISVALLLTSGGLAVSMCGSTLLAWEARRRQGATWMAFLGAAHLLFGTIGTLFAWGLHETPYPVDVWRILPWAGMALVGAAMLVVCAMPPVWRTMQRRRPEAAVPSA